MGSIQRCSDGCYSWVKGYNQKVKRLRLRYRSEYRDSIFYQICMDFVQQLHLLNKNGHGKQQQKQNMRGSLIDSIYSQQTPIILSSPTEDNQQNPRLPSRIASLSEADKKHMISDLIKKSYILLDISDVFGQQSANSYESHIKHKIFQNDDSVHDSFIDRKDALVQSLKKFHTATIYKLDSYVQMSENIKKSFNIQSDSLLSKLLFRMKSKLIQSFNTDQFQNIQALFANTRNMIHILQDTVIILFNIKFNKNKRRSNQQNSLSEQHQTFSQQSQQDKQIQFLNQVNFYTLISSIIFDDPKMHQFFERVVQQKFKNQINKFRQQTPMLDSYFVSKILNDQSMHSFFQPTIVALFNKKSDQINYFQKTVKMFTKLPNKLPPILKLKLLAEVEKQFLKQLKALCTQKQAQMIYDRMTSQLMATWLLTRDKKIGQNNITSVILAYAFVHTAYRLGAKGSTILSFVQSVEKILSWSIPGQ